MGEKQIELLEYLLSLTEEQMDKVIERIPDLRALIENEESEERKAS